jgi:hypothetical protein
LDVKATAKLNRNFKHNRKYLRMIRRFSQCASISEMKESRVRPPRIPRNPVAADDPAAQRRKRKAMNGGGSSSGGGDASSAKRMITSYKPMIGLFERVI